jgi:F-type H+-transporting ATPase subunit b
MLIDWFTVGAQIVNFLILMVLLKYFLYDRITGAMDAREEKINSRLQDADRKEKEAQEKAEALHKEKHELDQKRDQLLAEAKEHVRSKRKQWEQNARREAEDLRVRWHKALSEQKDSFARNLQQSIAEQIYAVCRKALKDLADVSLEKQIINAFIGRIEKMNSDQKKELVQSLDAADHPAVVHSAFEIGSTMRQRITRALRSEILDELEVDYQRAADLLAGIELKAGGKKIAWSLQDYLAALEENVVDALKAHAEAKLRKEQAPEKESGEK